MERDILFRGKSIATQRWIAGFFFKGEDNNAYIGYVKKSRYCPDTRDWDIAEYYENNPTYIWVFVKEEVCPETVGQYTGWKDKNGDKVFEGDILCFGGKNFVVHWNEESFQWQIRITDGEWTSAAYDGDPYDNISHNNITLGWVAAEEAIIGSISTFIIGNIYDNPEFLRENNNKASGER